MPTTIVDDPAELTRRCRLGENSKVPRFSKKTLAALKPAANGKTLLISSAALPCAYVVVDPSGNVAGAVQHRVLGPRKRIADFRIETIEQFERRAREILAAARQGRNLLAEEKAAARQKQAEQTVGMIVEQYLAEPGVKRKRSYKEKARYLRTVWASVHNEPAETVDRHALLPPLRRIATERGERTANAASSVLSACFGHAIEHGWLRRDANPVVHLPRWDEQARERALSVEELGKVWRAALLISASYGAVVQLLILTGSRRSEIADMLWSEVDLDRALINLPGSRTKNGRPFTIPLPPVAVEILRNQPRFGDRVFLPGLTWSRLKTRLDKLTELDQPFVLHDIRRSVATGLREYLSADTHLVELLLNHVSGSRASVAGTYDRSERLAERRRLLERWAELILRAAGEPVEGAKIVNLR